MNNAILYFFHTLLIEIFLDKQLLNITIIIITIYDIMRLSLFYFNHLFLSL